MWASKFYHRKWNGPAASHSCTSLPCDSQNPVAKIGLRILVCVCVCVCTRVSLTLLLRITAVVATTIFDFWGLCKKNLAETKFYHQKSPKHAQLVPYQDLFLVQPKCRSINKSLVASILRGMLSSLANTTTCMNSPPWRMKYEKSRKPLGRWQVRNPSTYGDDIWSLSRV